MTMKSFTASLLAAAAAIAFTACNSENTWDEYEEWREANNEWYQRQLTLTDTDGTPYYTKLAPAWYPTSGVLIHYFNDRAKTEGNLSPLVTSTSTPSISDASTTTSRLTHRSL